MIFSKYILFTHGITFGKRWARAHSPRQQRLTLTEHELQQYNEKKRENEQRNYDDEEKRTERWHKKHLTIKHPNYLVEFFCACPSVGSAECPMGNGISMSVRFVLCVCSTNKKRK